MNFSDPHFVSAKENKNGELVAFFNHPCRACGSPHAPFGYNVSIRKNQYGQWYCQEHKPAPAKV